MTPAASVSFFKPEFDNFLYASLVADKQGMPLSVLSALARLNVDPWEEAAELSELPRIPAAQRLALLIGQLPGDRWTPADSRTLADRLIELLPRRGGSRVVPSVVKADGFSQMIGSADTKVLICVALAAAVLIFAASREWSSRGERVDGQDTGSPTQTSRPSSR
jgi:hypothetical protein